MSDSYIIHILQLEILLCFNSNFAKTMTIEIKTQREMLKSDSQQVMKQLQAVTWKDAIKKTKWTQSKLPSQLMNEHEQKRRTIIAQPSEESIVLQERN